MHRQLACLLIALLAASAVFPADPPTRRMALLKLDPTASASTPRLIAGLKDRDPLVARTAARLLGAGGPRTLAALHGALGHRDPLVRRAAVLALVKAPGDPVADLAAALKDPEPVVRQAAVVALADRRPRLEASREMLLTMVADEDNAVRSAAQAAVAGYCALAMEQPLPLEGWKFRMDSDEVGQQEEWFRAGLDDSKWADIAVGRFWNDFGYGVGAGWYRLNWTTPAQAAGDRQLLHFGAADERAWVWVNGQYAGNHDLGTAGWDKPFEIDVTKFLKWGQPNQITVRVTNEAMAGGLHKPVTLVGLTLKD